MQNQPSYNQKERAGLSTGAALVLGISAIIVAFIITAGVVFVKSSQTLSDIGIEGLEVLVTDADGETTINVNTQTSDSPSTVSNPDQYSGLGFSVVLPDGVTAGNIQQSEGGPWQWVQFSDGTMVTFTDNIAFDDQYGTFPSGSSDLLVTVGAHQFYAVNGMGGRTTYYIEQNGVRYSIAQNSSSQIDLSTFDITG